ncbi:MAG: competence/damage-inducible protein A [Gemmatimonadetes bacterium]|nr:competence/damage-inducible protein A [Gemmatimonadota bacterium]
MDIDLVTIGTELLLGFTVDTNSAFAGRTLAEVGVRIARRTSIRDTPEEIRTAVGDALVRSRFVITTGGLGPTRDDVTKKVVADLFGAPLEFQDAIWEELTAKWARIGRKIPDSNRCQAEVPRGAMVLPNPRGTAPGLWLSGPLGEVVMLPGVPSEMRGLLVDQVVPRLAARSGGRAIVSRVLRTTAIPESTLATRLAQVEDSLDPLTLAYLPGLEGVDLRLTAWDMAPADAEPLLRSAAERIREIVGVNGYGEGDDDLAAVLLDRLRAKRWKLAVAESCTGGMVGQRLTDIPGSSEVFLGGVIAYHDNVKVRQLGVSPLTIERRGAVSEETVREMAAGVAAATGAEAAVAVTGIAGPGGGSDAKPVGTVWFGFSVAGRVEAERLGLPGTRADIRGRAAQYALFGIHRRLG